MPGRNFADTEEEQIANIYLAGHSARAIARAYNKSHHISIVAALKRQGVTQRSPSERNRLYKLNPHVFDVIDNELAAYFLGYIFADGNVNREKTLQFGIKWDDRELLEGIKDFLESEAPIKTTFVGNGFSSSQEKYKQVLFQVTERHLAKRLMELGIVAHRPSHMPIIESTPPELYNHLVRGYFDGDGHATKRKELGFCGSKKLTAWIRQLMASQAGTNPNLALTKHTISDLYYIRFSGRLQALKVANYLYHDATTWLSRKRNVINSWPEPQPRKKNKKGQYI